MRVQLAGLERDDIVAQGANRRGARKPSATYVLTAEGEALFPKAYGPVLGELLDVLAEQTSPEALETVLRIVGRRLAARQPVASQDRQARLAAAVGALNELGGLAELEAAEDSVLICGYSCPLAALVARRPEICRMAAVLLTEIAGEPVQEECERGAPPRCRFRLLGNGATGGGAGPTP